MVAAQAVIVNTMVTLTTTKDKRGLLAIHIATVIEKIAIIVPTTIWDASGNLPGPVIVHRMVPYDTSTSRSQTANIHGHTSGLFSNVSMSHVCVWNLLSF